MNMPATEVVFYPARLPYDWNKSQAQLSRVLQYVTDPAEALITAGFPGCAKRELRAGRIAQWKSTHLACSKHLCCKINKEWRNASVSPGSWLCNTPCNSHRIYFALGATASSTGKKGICTWYHGWACSRLHRPKQQKCTDVTNNEKHHSLESISTDSNLLNPAETGTRAAGNSSGSIRVILESHKAIPRRKLIVCP